ncbi:hypothetical protein [Streptomyces sp. NPDC020996]|uniref:hypothetical protein n=1 Tax=Streptomyces sp. NPDC020996 TaxID=3154791 RepID=UPI0033C9BDE0
MGRGCNGPETPGIRIHDVTDTGFLIRLNEVCAGAAKSDGKHTTETIGWLAATVRRASPGRGRSDRDGNRGGRSAKGPAHRAGPFAKR